MTRRRRSSGLGTLLVAVLVGLVLVFVLRSLHPEWFGASGAPRSVTIKRGSGVGTIARQLSAAGVIGSPLVFKVLARVTGADRTLRAGQYSFAPGTPMLELLRRLQKGSNFQVLIPEGLTIAEVADTLQAAIGVPREEFLQAAEDKAFRRRLEDPAATLEGYLFPDSYAILPEMTAREIVAEMTGRFQRVWREEFAHELPPPGFTRHEVVTLASIVEAESRRPEERPRIAAVYLNRLRLGMRLQADPTVAYAIAGRRRARIYYKDLQMKSPYNTYRRASLPPGPIGNPGRAAIAAIFHPTSPSDDVYFVANPDGSHTFSATFDAHHAAIAALRTRADSQAGVPR